MRCFCFFFQAEDGIRDYKVTGVQTCALPICAGITVSALDAGLTVTMIERDADSIARGQANVEKVYNGLIAKGRMTEEAKAAVMARYTPSTSYDDIKDVDLVIEEIGRASCRERV